MQERNPCSGCGRERRMISTNAAVSSPIAAARCLQRSPSSGLAVPRLPGGCPPNALTVPWQFALLGAAAAGLLGFDDIAGPLAPAARLAAEPDPAAAAFHAERHARFRRIVSALKVAAVEATQPSDAEVRTTTA